MEEIQVNTIETQDTREGTPQVLSNIDSWAAIADSLKTTLGPYGRDKMFLVNGEILITNDGATILKNMKIEHPAGRLLAAISESQDKEVGDGTTSVVLLACSILEQLKPLIKDSLDIKFIKNTLQEIQGKCLERLQNCKIDFNDDQFYSMAQTSLTSKILKYDKCKFADMIVNTFKQIEDIDDTRLVGIKKVSGGSISDSEMVDGVAFEKCFTYAGYEQQPKRIENPKIICLNVELEWKQERENCEVRLKSVEDYQAIVDAEWKLVRDKLDRIIDTGANVVLSSLPVGDYATQYFARKNIFCAGRVAKEDLFRIVNACGGKIYNSTNFLKIYGTCALFEEKQVGKLRYNYLSGGTKKAYTLIIRGPGEDVLNEVERSVNDAVMVVKRTLRNKNVVTGGGSTEMELSKYVREEGKSIAMKSALVYLAVARAFEIIPYQLAKNFGQDAIEIIQQLRYEHSNDKNHSGVNIKRGTSDMLEDGVLEPLLVKSNMIKASFSAVSALLMVDATIVSKGN